jgi:hypothetical protein
MTPSVLAVSHQEAYSWNVGTRSESGAGGGPCGAWAPPDAQAASEALQAADEY